MNTDARTLEDGTLIEGDLCIIGAGAAGISVALEWEQSGHKVILLEGGGFNVEADIQDLYAGESVGHRYYPLQSARLHFFGGTTGHWGGWCAPYDPQDFKARSWVPHSGWPITREDLDPFYERARHLVELPRSTWDVADYENPETGMSRLQFDPSRVWTKMWQMSPPTRFGQKYREPILTSQQIHLFTYANVCNIDADESASTVREVQVRCLNGKTHTVRARHYVLACGAMQNARLLLASNRQAPNGLGNDHDQVGRYFMEHIEVQSANLMLPASRVMNLYRADIFITEAFGELALTEAMQEELQILNGTASLLLQPLSETPLGIEHFSEDAAEMIEFFDQTQDMVEDGSRSASDFSTVRQYVMATRLEQAPNPDSRIMLSAEKDALGMPRTRLDWQLTAFDKHSIRTMYEVFGAEAGRAGIGRVQLMDWLSGEEPMWPAFQGAGWHHMGTTRMHDDPRQGVVDAQCKVHGIDNLHVAGSSTFTTAGAANPTLTLIALTLRLSDHLKEHLG
jgi:choline dehydrogenase-like flavoprotein